MGYAFNGLISKWQQYRQCCILLAGLLASGRLGLALFFLFEYSRSVSLSVCLPPSFYFSHTCCLFPFSVSDFSEKSISGNRKPTDARTHALTFTHTRRRSWTRTRGMILSFFCCFLCGLLFFVHSFICVIFANICIYVRARTHIYINQRTKKT